MTHNNPGTSMHSWDAIVVGSGIGGLACASALAKTGKRVLVLEKHWVPGGLTQTFSRDGFTWDVGVHYLGDMGPQGGARRILDWLDDGEIEFAAIGPVYDTVHFPGDFEIQFSRPEAAHKLDLKEKFPDAQMEIEEFFSVLAEAERAGRAIFAQRAMPALLSKLYELWYQADIQKWWGRTVSQVMHQLISDPHLRAVLIAQRGDYGGIPDKASFGVHATVMRHYFNGASYPVGGAQVFAAKLVPVIERAGGEVRVNAEVKSLVINDGRVGGVSLNSGEVIECAKVVSDIGVHGTVSYLLPDELRSSEWAREVLAFQPSVAHIGLYLGLEGDIRANGATASNHWFYETWDVDKGFWQGPFDTSPLPALFVSFPSLKDPKHDPGPKNRHTAEAVALVGWESFRQWQDSIYGKRPEEYTAYKARIEENMVQQFKRRFPALGPMIVRHELSTPLSMVAFTGAYEGAIYGIECSPSRFLSRSLRAQTPIPGLFLTGQDVVSPGVTGAMMGGVLAAAAMQPEIFAHLA